MKEEERTKEQLVSELVESLQQAELRAQELDTLEQIARTVSSGLNLETTLETIYEQVQHVMQVDAFFVALYDEHTRLISYPLVYDQGQRYQESPFPLPPKGKLTRVLDTGEPLLINRTPQEVEAVVMRPETAIGDKDKPSASLLYVPLYLGSRLAGAMSVQSYRFDAYDQQDVALLTRIASHAAIAIENARLYDEAQQRVAELETLRHTSLQLTSSLDLPTVLRTIVESALALVGATDCLIYLYDEASESFTFGGALGKWAAKGSLLTPRPNGFTDTVARAGRPVVINDAVGHPLYASPEAQRWNVQAIAGFPLQRSGRLLGVLHVIFVEPHVFREGELRVLGLLADQAGIAVENSQLYAQAQQEIAERKRAEESLRESEERYRTLFDGVPVGLYRTTPAGQIVDANLGAVQMLGYPSREDLLAINSASLYLDPQDRVRWQALMRQQGVVRDFEVRFCRRDGAAIWVNNAARADRDEQGRVLYYEGSLEDITERKRAEDALRRLQEFNESIVQNMAEGIVVDDSEGYITFVNPAAAALLGYEMEELVGQHWSIVIPPEQQSITQAANERRAQRQSDRYEIRAVRKDGTRVPIQVSGSPRLEANTGGFAGTLAVFTDLTERIRVEEELRKHRDHLEELVSERTAALTEANVQLQQEIAERERAEAERERLLAAARAQARREAALFRLSAELAATLDEAEVCKRVVHGLRDTLDYDSIGLYLADEATGDRVLAAFVGFVAPPARISPGQGLSERPLLDGQPHYTPDVTQEPRYLHGLCGSEMDVPIRAGDRVLGVLIAESRQLDGFGQDDLEILTASAQQAGLAIEKARLLAAERQRADELDALRTTMADITAELELSALLQVIVERAAALLDAFGGELGLYHEADRKVEVVVSYNLGEGYVGTRHGLGEGAMGRVAEAGEPLIIEDYAAWEGRAPQYADVPIRASLVAPLVVGSRLVGVISIVATDPRRQFGPPDLHLLNLFAQQAAIAIENARLFGEAERRVAELATLTDIGQALSSTLRVDEVLQLIYEQTRRVMYAENMVIMLYDRARHEIECAFSSNPDDITPGACYPADLGLTSHIIKSRTSVLLQDSVDEGIRKLGLGTVGQPSASWLGVPMLMGKRVLGVIIVQHYTVPNVYDESHQVLLETIANQAAIAIENARLYDQAQREIAERVRAEEELRRYQERLEELVEERTAELRESEERYRTLFDGVPVGLYRTTPEGQIVDANSAMVQMLGFPDKEAALAVNAAQYYVDPEDRVWWKALVAREGILRDFEYRLRRYDGAVIWVNDTARAVRDEEGHILYYEGSSEDVTERKRAEEELRQYREHLEELVEERTAELRESEERYRTLFDGVPVGLYRTTPAGQVMATNQAAAQMLGLPSLEAALELDNTASLYMDPKERLRWQMLMEQEGIVRDFEYQVRRRDGSIIWINDTARAVRDEEGQVSYYEGSLEDITERKQAEEELRQAKEAAEAANRAKSTFLANMSHELRTPLNVILGFTQLMDGDANLTAEQQENLGIINRSGEHLLTLINDVLEMSKIEAGRTTLQENRFDLYRLLDDLEEMFGLRAEDKGLALRFERAKNVPQYVLADESKLRQVMVNLLSNAVKFTGQGGITLRVREAISALFPAPYSLLFFEVEDTGPGIAPEELTVVFDAFVQTESGQSSQEGTGLGLPISRQYVRLMGGDLTVSSELGQGSVFRFDVRVGLADAADVRLVRPTRRVLGLEPDQPTYRLLVVDDRETTRRLLVKMLEPVGFEVREAANGREAIEVWERWQPNLIWMDMRMPVMDGHQATRQIKASAQGRATAIIALTATAFEEDREKILLEGCDDFVRKPFRRDEIFDMLAKHLGVRFVYDEEGAQPSAALSKDAAALALEVLTPAALAALPADWVADLREATVRADLNLLLTLIDQIHGENAALSDALADLARDFEYKKILAFVEQAGG